MSATISRYELEETVIRRALFSTDEIVSQLFTKIDLTQFTDKVLNALAIHISFNGVKNLERNSICGVTAGLVQSLLDKGLPRINLQQAIQNLTEAPEPKSELPVKIPTISSGGVTLIQGSTIKPESIVWLWEGWMPCGKLVILAGQPGTGKTTVMLSLAAIITIGGRLPDHSTSSIGSVVIWSGEDGIADTLVPRLTVMGADMTKVYFVEGSGNLPFDPSKDMPKLAEQIKTVPGVKLVIVDPVVSAINGDSHKNAEVRKGLQPLVDIGRETGACIVGISHFNKSGGNTANPLDLISGSIAFAAVARVVIGAAKLQNIDEHGHSRIFCRIKSNIGPDEDGVGYGLRMELLPDQPDIIASTVLWGQIVKGHSRDLLGQAQLTKPEAKNKLGQAIDFLREQLSGGAVATTTLDDEAKTAGITTCTLRRAKESLGVNNHKAPGKDGKWLCKLQRAPEQERCSNSIKPFDGQLSQHEQFTPQNNMSNLPMLIIEKGDENMSKLHSEMSFSGDD